MGFGGGAMIGSPLSISLMNHYKSATSTGLAETFATMGIIYFIYMMFGVFTIRLPAKDWAPAGYVAPVNPHGMITTHQVSVNEAMRTPQFYLLWICLCVNVTAGIGILEQASPMIQEMFKPKITVAAAGGFVGLLSLANMTGRFVWSSFSDVIGRKATYATFFTIGIICYWFIPNIGDSGSVAIFVLVAVLVISMYGGGFATIPAYLRDMFGTMQVGAIHGRLLTAWSTAGVLGPLLVNQLRKAQIAKGLAGSDVYSVSMHVMAGLLFIGFIANLLVRPVKEEHWYVGMSETGTFHPPSSAKAKAGAVT
jgi:MFS family permease